MGGRGNWNLYVKEDYKIFFKKREIQNSEQIRSLFADYFVLQMTVTGERPAQGRETCK